MKNILVVFGVVLLAWFGLSFFDMTSSKNSEEQEFNESGRAKAIESETDLWNIYEGEESNLSFISVILGFLSFYVSFFISYM